MDHLTLSLVIVFVGITLIPLITPRFSIPVIVAELLFGIVLGDSFFGIIPNHEIIEFFATFGLTYLMFLAGLELNIEKLSKGLKKTGIITAFSVVVPLIGGVLLAPFLGIHPLIPGTIFAATSLGLILPLTKELHGRSQFKAMLLNSVVLVEIVTVFLLAFSLAFIDGSLSISFLYSFLIILVLFFIPWAIKRSRTTHAIYTWFNEKRGFAVKERFSFALIFLFAAISEQLGFHSIIGAFIAGLIVSEISTEVSLLQHRLNQFGYSFFIPLFFIFTAANVDLPAVLSNLSQVKLLIAVVVVGILSNVIGVGIGARIAGFNKRESLALGFFHGTLLSLTIAVAEVGRRSGLLTEGMFSIFVLLAIISSVIGPIAGKAILGTEEAQKA
jgi:Kef-type K+ transport system membrane component KefB